MKGSPLFRALVFVIVWACLAPLIWSMTSSRSNQKQAATPSASSSATNISAWITLDFSSLPNRFSLTHQDTILLQGQDVAAFSLEAPVQLPIPDDGLQLYLEVDWPETAGVNVVRIRIAPDGLPEREQNIWVQQHFRRSLRFSW